MESLKPFLIPIAGLKNGSHHFDFQIDEGFFQHFEDSPIQQGNFQVELELDKRFDMIISLISISGTIPTSCDRCTAAINLPVVGDYTLIMKYDNESEMEDQADFVYISQEDTILDVSKYIYEYITISVPLISVYNCETEQIVPCNQIILDKLNGTNLDSDQEPPSNPIWDILKDLK